ncbi:hypothetical protein CGRA01v4_02980 [Colletotrichum graminicola]|nr:hypothetical protein CGRA01v4_02980 [Colletotrichum graminicola]
MPQHNSFPPFGYTRCRPVLLGNKARRRILSAGPHTFLSQAGGSFFPPSHPPNPSAHSPLHIPAQIEGSRSLARSLQHCEVKVQPTAQDPP